MVIHSPKKKTFKKNVAHCFETLHSLKQLFGSRKCHARNSMFSLRMKSFPFEKNWFIKQIYIYIYPTFGLALAMPVPPFPASFPGGGFIGPTQMPDHPSLVRKSASTGVIGAVPMWRKAWEIGGPATECSLTIGVWKTGWKPHGIPWVPWFIIVWNGHNLGSTPFLDQPHLTRPRDTALLPLLGTLQQRSPAGFVLGEEVAVHRLRWEVPGWKCKDFLDFPSRNRPNHGDVSWIKKHREKKGHLNPATINEPFLISGPFLQVITPLENPQRSSDESRNRPGGRGAKESAESAASSPRPCALKVWWLMVKQTPELVHLFLSIPKNWIIYLYIAKEC